MYYKCIAHPLDSQAAAVHDSQAAAVRSQGHLGLLTVPSLSTLPTTLGSTAAMLAGKKALVTGASKGVGEPGSRVLLLPKQRCLAKCRVHQPACVCRRRHRRAAGPRGRLGVPGGAQRGLPAGDCPSVQGQRRNGRCSVPLRPWQSTGGGCALQGCAGLPTPASPIEMSDLRPSASLAVRRWTGWVQRCWRRTAASMCW